MKNGFSLRESRHHLKERLEKEIQDGVESIVLYGSLARNEAHEDSDIDILIVAFRVSSKTR